MTTRNARDATTIRTALKACGLSSRNAVLMTEKLLPQMTAIRSRRRPREVTSCRIRGAGARGLKVRFRVQGSVQGPTVQTFDCAVLTSSAARVVRFIAEP